MDDDIVTYLAPAIGYNIHTLDLSNNDISEHGAWELGKMLQRHAEYRDNDLWETGLRGEQIAPPRKKDGICNLYLANNELGDAGAGKIASALFYDVWL